MSTETYKEMLDYLEKQRAKLADLRTRVEEPLRLRNNTRLALKPIEI